MIEPDPYCEYCEGSGVVIFPAIQEGGRITNEKESRCVCTFPEPNEID